MKIKHKKRYPKKIVIACIISVLLVASPFVYVYAFKGNLFGWKISSTTVTSEPSNINYGPATPDQQSAGSKTKTNSTSDTPPEPTIIPDSTKKSVEVSITSHGQNGSTFQIRALISNLDGAGLCTLTLTSPGQTTVTKTANTQSLASTSTCQGFDVPVSELPTGTWHAVINYSSDSLIGSSSIDEVIK